MNQIQQIFNYADAEVRVVVVDDEPWFVAKDVCEVLEIKNPTDALKRLDEDERARLNLGRQGETNVINEPGLYSLILGSRKPEARAFKRWVTHEVLPSIRKTGGYMLPQSLPEALRLAADLAEKNELLLLQNAQKEQMICEMKPKATYYDLVLQSKSLISITQIAKDYGMSGRKMNAILRDLGVQYKRRGCWLLYQEYAECGYTQSRTYVIGDTTSKMNTCWTQKGRLFIYDLLKNKKGLLPLIEREEMAS